MSADARRARTAVGVVFALNGLLFASLISRVPDIRAGLELDNGSLGLLLLAIAVGSLVALPSSGRLIERWSASLVVRWGAVVGGAGLAVAALGVATGTVPLTAVGLVVYGAGIGAWDVAMNVEGAEVERLLARTVMPRFHAGFSLGTVAGAALAVPVVASGVPMLAHLLVLAAVAVVVVAAVVGGFLPVQVSEGDHDRPRAGSAWLEPRTLVIGVMVLCFAVAEGSANDWLALALVDGHGASHAVGVAGFGLFVTAMTVGRLLGPMLLDRWGRAATLWCTAVLVAAGLLLLVHGGPAPVVVLGILLWGLGASLGFPVGMSAAADDPSRSAARVSVVSTIGYAAFLAGPPLLGALGDRVGTLDALQVVMVLMVPAAFAVLVTRRAEVS
ncbi:MFS transporter [soil metagenome]